MTRPVTSRLFSPLKPREEETFILGCLRAWLGEEADGGLSGVDLPAIDWKRALEKSIRWGVAPLLHAHIRRRPAPRGAEEIPDQFLQDIRMEFIRTWATNEINFKKLLDIVRALNGAGTRTILLKGSHLARYVYRDIGLRPMIDMDILVKKEDLPRAEELLARMGYEYPELSQAVYDSFGVRRDDGGQAGLVEEYRISHHHLHPLRDPGGMKLLDIHWTLVPPSLPFTIDTEGLWRRAESGKIDGEEVLLLSPEDLLLHLSLHASFSNKFRIHALRSLCDIAMAVNRCGDRIDWEELRARARGWGVERFAYLSLRLSRELLGAGVPDTVIDDLEPGRFEERIALEASRRIIRREAAGAVIHRPEMFRGDVGLREKISFILRRIFILPEEPARAHSLPPSSKRVRLYYCTRLLSLPCRYLALYARFFLYLLTHKDADPLHFNLDTFLNAGSGRS